MPTAAFPLDPDCVVICTHGFQERVATAALHGKGALEAVHALERAGVLGRTAAERQFLAEHQERQAARSGLKDAANAVSAARVTNGANGVLDSAGTAAHHGMAALDAVHALERASGLGRAAAERDFLAEHQAKQASSAVDVSPQPQRSVYAVRSLRAPFAREDVSESDPQCRPLEPNLNRAGGCFAVGE